MGNNIYTVKQLLQLNEESTKNEFNPKFGNGVKRNSNDNDKAVKEILKNAESLNKGVENKKIKRKPEIEFEDYNKTPMDANFEYEPPKQWKERVEKLATDGTESDKADYYSTDTNKEFYKNRNKKYNERSEREENERKKGIVGNNNTQNKAKDYTNVSGYVNENAKPLKRLKFKNTIFLSEAQVLAKVPEDYRVDENKFYIQDKTGTDYLVECKADPFGYVHMEITNKLNKKIINEELDKMRKLADYNYKDDNVKIDKSQISGMSESINNLRQLLNE